MDPVIEKNEVRVIGTNHSKNTTGFYLFTEEKVPGVNLHVDYHKVKFVATKQKDDVVTATVSVERDEGYVYIRKVVITAREAMVAKFMEAVGITPMFALYDY